MASQSIRFWDRIADRYSKKPVPDEAVYQKKLRITREYLNPTMQVLEMGCGTGSTAINHAPFVKHIHATDVSGRMLEIAADKAKAGDITNISFEQASVEDLQIDDESLDAVLALSLLHLLEDKDAAIQRVHRMLKPGGVFVTSTACLGDTMKFFKYIGPIGSFFGLIPSLNVFTKQELLDSLVQAGFEIDHEWQPGKGKSVFLVAKKA